MVDQATNVIGTVASLDLDLDEPIRTGDSIISIRMLYPKPCFFVNILMTHDQSEIFHQLVYQTDDKTITRIRTEGSKVIVFPPTQRK